MRLRWLAAAAALTAALAGCSSSGSSPRSAPTGATSTAAANPVERYLDAVNTLCDALLYQVVNGPDGGSINVTAQEYLKTWPAHKRLLDGFDAALAAVQVPAAASGKAAALRAYVRYADKLDQTRLAAAQKGQAAYAKQVESESGVHDNPVISAVVSAGFKTSCASR